MKLFTSLLAALIVANSSVAGHLPDHILKTVTENINTGPGIQDARYAEIQKLCIRAFGDELAEDDLVALSDFADGNTSFTQSQEESYWRIAANFAVFNVDGDVDRLYNLAAGKHLDVAIASLNVLRVLEPDPAIGDFFITRFFDDWDRSTDKQNNDRRGEWCSVIAEGLIRHAGQKLSTDIVPFIDKRVLDTTMMVSLFFAAIEQASVNEGAYAIARITFSRTMEPFYLSDMASALRSINQERVVAQKADALNKAVNALAPATVGFD